MEIKNMIRTGALFVLLFLAISECDVHLQNTLGRTSFEQSEQVRLVCRNTNDTTTTLYYSTVSLGVCYGSAEFCSDTNSDPFTLSFNVSAVPYLYYVDFNNGFNHSLCGEYICTDSELGFSDSVELSYQQFDNTSYRFDEDGNGVNITLECVFPETSVGVKWFIVIANKTQELKTEETGGHVAQFKLLSTCQSVSCSGQNAKNVTFGLTVKQSNGTVKRQSKRNLMQVPIQVQVRHALFPERIIVHTSLKLYYVQDFNDCLSSPCQHESTCYDGFGFYDCICSAGFTGRNCQTVVAGVQDPSDIWSYLTPILISIGCVVFVLFVVWGCSCCYYKKKDNGLRGCIVICICRILICNFLKPKKKTKLFWTTPGQHTKCIARCPHPGMCNIDKSFHDIWSTRWKNITCSKWNDEPISNRKTKFLVNKDIIKQLWQNNDARSNALNRFFQMATDDTKKEILTKPFKNLKRNKRNSCVFLDWQKLNDIDKHRFLPSLGHCTKLMSLLWHHLQNSLKGKLFLHIWTFLDTDIQKALCKMVLKSKVTYQEIEDRIALSRTDTSIENDRSRRLPIQFSLHDKHLTVKQLQVYLSNCEPGVRSQIVEDIHMKITFEENNEKFDELFEKLSEDIKLHMMGKPDLSGKSTVFVTSEFWLKWSEHEKEIPHKESCCVGQFISMCNFERMHWQNIKEVLTHYEICDICMHVEWAYITEDIRHLWMDDQWKKDAPKCNQNRHIPSINETSHDMHVACTGKATGQGLTRIRFYFDDGVRRTKKESIAATIISITCKPLCKDKEFNDVMAAMLERAGLARYLRRIPEWEGSADEAKQDILTVLREYGGAKAGEVLFDFPVKK